MERQEIIAKSEEVISLMPFKSKQYMEENYREMATELLDAKSYSECLFEATNEILGEEEARNVYERAEAIYEKETSSLDEKEEEVSSDQKAVLDKLFPPSL